MGLIEKLKNLFKPSGDLSVPTVTIERAMNVKSLLDKMGDPDEVLKKNNKTLSFYKSLLYDSQVEACFSSRFAGSLLREFEIVTEGTTAEDLKARDFIDEVFGHLNITAIKSGFLDAIPFGYSVSEILYQSDGGYWFPSNIIEKPQEWFDFNSDGGLLFFPKSGKAEVLDTNIKFMLCQHNPSYANPYGVKLLSKIFWSVMFKQGGWQFWMEFAEKFGQAFILGKYPQSWDAKDPATQQKIDKLIDSLSKMIRTATAAVPDNTSMQIVENQSKSESGGLFKSIIEQCDNDIAKVILGGTLTNSQGDTGSYALGQVHLEVRDNIIDSDLLFLKHYFNDLIRRIVDLNFNVTAYPTYEHTEDEDLKRGNAERDTILFGQGLRFSKSYYQKTYGFGDEDINVVEAGYNPMSAEAYQFAETPKKQDDKDSFKKEAKRYGELLDGLINASIQVGRKRFTDVGKNLKSTLNKTESFEDAENAVLSVIAEDSENETDRQIEDLFFLSQSLGALKAITLSANKSRVKKFTEEDDITLDFLRDFNRKSGENLKDSELRDLIKSARKSMDEIWASKLAVSPDVYDSLSARAKAKAFSISGGYSEDAVKNIYESLYNTWKSGGDFTAWKKTVGEKLTKEGIIPEHQLQIVYRQNLINNYNNESYRTLKENASLFPYWRYVSVIDERTTTLCGDLHNTVKRADDPFWEQYYPPNHFGCRADVEALTEDEARKYLDIEPKDIEKATSGIKEDFAVNSGVTYWGKVAIDNDEKGYQSGLKDPAKHTVKVKELLSEALDKSSLFNRPLDNANTIKDLLGDITVDRYITDSKAKGVSGETLVLKDFKGRAIHLNLDYVLSHIKDKAGHLEAVPYIKDAIANPQAVLFSPRVSDSTGKVFMNHYYYVKGKVPIGERTEERIIKITVRYNDKKYYTVTAFIEGNDLKEVGLKEK